MVALLAGFLLMVGVLPLAVDDASAVPGFARQNQMACSNCHTTWSQLTEYGRQFKESGYAPTGPTQEISENLSWYDKVPFSGRLNMRLVDVRHSKTKTGEVTDKDKQLKMRAVHEFEVFFAGMVSQKFSFFGEIEGEDESVVGTDEEEKGFGMWFAMGAVGIHLRPEFNVNLGWGSALFADPYNTIYSRRTNRYERVIDKFLPGKAQFLSFSGRYQNLFYMAVLHDHPENGSLDAEGHDPYDFSGRLAYDVLSEEEGRPHVSVGGLVTVYTQTAYDTLGGRIGTFSYNSFGGDLQVDYQGAHLNVAFVNTESPVDTDGDGLGDETTSDFCLSIEGHYFYTKEDRPYFGPSVIFEKYTENDGNDDWARLGAFVTYYPKENVRAQLGWEGDVSAPDIYTNKEGRITVVLDLGF